MRTNNAQGVGRSGDTIVVVHPKDTMTTEEAVLHAAWLAVMADPSGERFADARKAVEGP